jgi:hypothetical protein
MGIPAILYCFFFLYLVFSGAGAWSVDTMIAHGAKPSGAPGNALATPRKEGARVSRGFR